MKLKLFISYATEDENLRKELDKHLTSLKRQDVIETWHDRMISLGTDREEEIDKNLNTADLILLLVSADFLASDYRYEKEMQRAIELHNQDVADVIPIILRPCDWETAPFSNLKALPIALGENKPKPVIKWVSRDEAFEQIAKAIRGVAEEREKRIFRSRCRQRIISQYNQIRLLNQMESSLEQFYVDVSLQKPHAQYNIVDIVEQKNHLLILGNPGAGKTTLLKHLAVLCSRQRLHRNLIPVLIELRLTQSESEWSLLETISNKLEIPSQQIEKLLLQGQLFILIDGLDEIQSMVVRANVQRQVCDLAQNPQYEKNRFILTCRTQIINEMPQGFTSVVLTDFTPRRVQQFVKNWFSASRRLSENEVENRWQAFSEVFDKKPAFKELPRTPVMLSLMCWIFESPEKLPTQAASLYDQGINLLLKREELPEGERGNKIYCALTLEQKKRLLTNIAVWKFEHPENLMVCEREVLTKQIVKLLNLANPQDGADVLRAIEAQLNFQEHFSAQWLTQPTFEQLASKIVDPQWQDRVKQLVKSQPSDNLLKLIKQVIDRSISQDVEYQDFLTWVYQKAESDTARYKSSAGRAFYFALARACTLDFNLEPNIALALDLAPNFDRDSDHAFARYLVYTLVYDLTCALTRALVLTIVLILILARALDFVCTSTLAFALSCTYSLALAFKPELVQKLQGLVEKDLIKHHFESFRRWWLSKGREWIQSLRQIMIEHQNVCHDWQFNEAQKKALWQYYDSNSFLVELLKLDGGVSQPVRQEIEDNLLLPITILQKRLPGIYEDPHATPYPVSGLA